MRLSILLENTKDEKLCLKYFLVKTCWLNGEINEFSKYFHFKFFYKNIIFCLLINNKVKLIFNQILFFLIRIIFKYALRSHLQTSNIF